MKTYLIGLLFFCALPSRQIFAQDTRAEEAASQKPTFSISGYDGTVLVGYVDGGAFLNFTGPHLNVSTKSSKLILGMLPSLRFKEDNSEPKNALVMPTLGVGLTYSYKKVAIQVPLYYNAKTATKNGTWYVGIGLGIRQK